MIAELKTVAGQKGENVAKAERAVKMTQSTQPEAFATAVQAPLEKFMDAARVEAVVGTPIKHGDSLVIPTAEVFNAMGFGMGLGLAKDDDDGLAGPAGGGGGGQAQARPVAMIVMSPTGVRVEPVVDVTKIALAAFTAAGFIGAMLWRMSRAGRVP